MALRVTWTCGSCLRENVLADGTELSFVYLQWGGKVVVGVFTGSVYQAADDDAPKARIILVDKFGEPEQVRLTGIELAARRAKRVSCWGVLPVLNAPSSIAVELDRWCASPKPSSSDQALDYISV